MPYTPDATDITQPADSGVKASTAAAEFRTLKAYIKNNLLGGTVAFTGNPTVPLLGAGDSTAKIASAAFVQQEITRLTGLVVNSAGNVGIGTSSPARALDVAGIAARFRGDSFFHEFYNTANTTRSGYLQIAAAGTSRLAVEVAQPLALQTSGIDRLTVDATGNVGIGTSAPNSKLGVAGDIQMQTSTATYIYAGPSGSVAVGLLFDVANNVMRVYTAGTERMRIDSAGNVSIGAAASGSAILDVQSTTKGLRLPNMTTTQKNAIESPAAGLMIFDTTLGKACLYTGAAWQTITSA